MYQNLGKIKYKKASGDFPEDRRVKKLAEHYHEVQFYEDDEYLVESIYNFIKRGSPAVVIANGEYINSIKQYINLKGDSFKPLFLDAEETLTKIMVGGMPDKRKLEDIITKGVARTKNGHEGKVRIYGDMSALLWERENKDAALLLEKLWNDLAEKHNFLFLCSYSLKSVAGEENMDKFENICRQHSRIVPAESYSLAKLEEERTREIARLQQRAISFELEIKRRKILEKIKEEFIALISHELKTPVTSLKMFTQMLIRRYEKEGGPVDSAFQLVKMDAQISKLQKLVDELMDINKIDEGKLSYKMGGFDMDEVITKVLDKTQLLTNGHVIIRKGSSPRDVYGDRKRVGQVLMSLITNAVKFSPYSDKVVLSQKANGRFLTVSVRDFGLGISADEKKSLFERFYRGAEIKQKTFPGLGLGLYLASEIIKRHGGKIWVEDAKGPGSIFSFTIPLTN
jgi:signal transduction histidine kinase